MPATALEMPSLVILRHQEGMSVRNISTGLSNSGNCINRRAGILSQQSERDIVRACLVQPGAIARQLGSKVCGPVMRVSVDTVKRTLRRAGLVTQRPKKAPSLTLQQMKVRLAWAKRY